MIGEYLCKFTKVVSQTVLTSHTVLSDLHAQAAFCLLQNCAVIKLMSTVCLCVENDLEY